MRKALWLLALLAGMLMVYPPLYAATGDVTIRFNGGGEHNQVYTGETNTMELIITNSNPVYGMSLGFEMTSALAGFSVLTPYGDHGSPALFIQEWGDAQGAFDLGFLMATGNMLPDSFLIGGAAMSKPLPAHASPTKLYDLKIVMPAGQDSFPNGFCVDNIYFPPAGSWKFDFGSPIGAIAPTFNGQPNASTTNPDAPPQCFLILKRPCKNPIFTSTPGATVNRSHCSDYSFDFNATEGGNDPPADPVTFTTTAGTINSTTGLLTVPKKSTCGTTNVTVTAHNACGSHTDYPFVITWTNSVPVITNCPTSQQEVGMGYTFTTDLNRTDGDYCDYQSWSVIQTCGPDATGRFSINSSGVFTFNTLNPDDRDSVFCFCATITDQCGGTDECCFEVKVLAQQPFIRGDANHDGMIDISDVVYLIDYIFRGGPAPVPLAAGDANCGGTVDVGDIVFLISYIFRHGPAPPC